MPDEANNSFSLFGKIPESKRPSSPIEHPIDRSKDLFDWSDWTTKPPPLEKHSEAKLNVLRSYIEDYITILCTGNPGMEYFKLSIVDGFAGGGIYQDGSLGSPFVILHAVQAAQARVNAARLKPIIIDCNFYFIEKHPKAADCLEHHIKHFGYGADLGKKITLIRGEFGTSYEKIVTDINNRHKRGGSRVIFFLDQCGYSAAPPTLLRLISEKLNWKAEFIVNLAIGWLTAYHSNEETFRSIFPRLGLESVLPIEKILAKTKNQEFNPQYVIESLVGPAFHTVSGIPFFSPFYIQAPKSNRGYWLLHLAPQSRARTAMLDVLWRIANGARHFGHTGLNMLSYKPEADPAGYLDGLDFSDSTQVSLLGQLGPDLSKEIRENHKAGITYREFADLYCNQTMANDELLRSTLIHLMQQGEIEVYGKEGGAKRTDSVNPDDIIKPGSSPFLISIPRFRKK